MEGRKRTTIITVGVIDPENAGKHVEAPGLHNCDGTQFYVAEVQKGRPNDPGRGVRQLGTFCGGEGSVDALNAILEQNRMIRVCEMPESRGVIGDFKVRVE